MRCFTIRYHFQRWCLVIKNLALRDLSNLSLSLFAKRFPKIQLILSVIPKHCYPQHLPKSKMASELNINDLPSNAKKNYKCNQCGYFCNVPSNLKTHMRVHSGEKPFVCSQCNYCCNQAGRLIIHMQIHSGEKCSFFCRQPSGLGVFNTLSDSIQYLNFAKK